ncbi:MAG: glycosyl hydrolase 53 family protein, partial [Cryomorphaceae bacterium]
AYTSMSDAEIEDAYFDYIQYLMGQFNPNYLVAGIEVNELYIHSPEKWEGYKALMQNVIMRIRAEHPNLEISESMTLHNLYLPDIDNQTDYLEEMTGYINAMDFVAISFYPFFKNLHTQNDFQGAFDFLHDRVNRPIAFVETCTIAEEVIDLDRLWRDTGLLDEAGDERLAWNTWGGYFTR